MQQYIFKTNPNLKVTSWDDSISHLTGIKTADAIGKKYNIVFPKILYKDKDALLLTLEKRKKIQLKNHNFQCLTSKIKAHITVEPLPTSQNINEICVTISDISPCFILQKLKDSQRLIDIGKTASALAHGVRNPLNAIKGAVVYLSEKYSRESELLEFSSIMQEEISKLDNFIANFLSTSFSEFNISDVDINSILKKLEILISLQTSAKKIKTIYKYGIIPKIMINAFQLEQAILNVINNALEAMPEGGTLKVKTYTENVLNDAFAVIEISDTGPGIPKSKINNLWSNCDKGHGFGLCITREILQYYKGKIEIKNLKGKGTTVKLYLRCC